MKQPGFHEIVTRVLGIHISTNAPQVKKSIGVRSPPDEIDTANWFRKHDTEVTLKVYVKSIFKKL